MKLLREDWGFEGHFVSDCWAIRDFHERHKVTSKPTESVTMALKAGCDLNCGCTYQHIMKAYEEGMISEEDITRCAVRLFTTRFLLGILGDKGSEYDAIPYEVVECRRHQEMAYHAARKSCVLLKNNGLLPLDQRGCGTIGVNGFGCEKLNITNCDIYECSDGAVDVTYCTEVLVSGCDIHDIGVKSNYAAYNLFEVNFGSGFTAYNCKVHNNKAEGLLYANEAENVSFLSNEVTKNVFSSGAFNFIMKGATVDGCSFEDNNCKNWYGAGSNCKATDIDGNLIAADQFASMKYRDIEPDKVVQRTDTVPTGNAKDVPAGTEVEVTTVDEFLEVIGPDRTIVLDGTNFDLTKAKDYGGIGTEFYSWEETYDGPQLVIHDVKNLTIKAKDSDPAATTLEALPRYANVLVFKNCGNVTVEGFTAGHTKEQGVCSGGVIYFSGCENSRVENMRLYGCGVTGVDTFMCSGVDVINTEIYECSYGAVYFSMTSDINFKNCNIHDVPSPALTFSDCQNITWNDQNLEGDELRYDVEHDGTLVVWAST
jgi:hypothetical protein